MPRMKILNSVEREVFDFPPIFNSVERKRQASGFGRNQAPKTDRLNQVPSWEFRNRLKSFTPRQLARILWDFAYLCWGNTQRGEALGAAGVFSSFGLGRQRMLGMFFERKAKR